MKEKPTIGVLTTFSQFDSSYSLHSVVESQLIPLVKYGYKTVLFVHDNFVDEKKIPSGVEIRKVVPRFLLIDYSSHQEPLLGIEEQADKVYEMLKKHAQDVDIMIEHDLIFQGWFLPYCMGIHQFAKESPMRWFHWIHSHPRSQPADLKYPHTLRYQLPRNSKLVYLNNHYLIHAAEAYNAWPKDVRIVYNALDPRSFFALHPLIHSLIEKYDILSSDFLQVYPVSTPRMIDGKQLPILIDIQGKMRLLGKRFTLVVANAHANDKREKAAIAEMLSYAAQRGIGQQDLIFTSLEDAPKYELGVPREVVSQLLRLTNLYIFPTTSENCPLTLLEAMLTKNLLILNDSVPPLREFAKENALYFKFGGIKETMNWDNREKFMEDVARLIISEFENNRALKASSDIKKSFNYDYIFKHQIEPLFYEAM